MKVKNLKIYVANLALITSAICTGCSMTTDNNTDGYFDKKNFYTTDNSSFNYDINDNSSSFNNDINENSSSSNSYTLDSSTSSEIESVTLDSLTEIEKSMLNKKEHIGSDFSSTLNIINNTDINIPYKELFEIEAALNNYKNIKEQNVNRSSNIIENNKVDKNRLRLTIINNSKNTVSNDLINRCSNIISNDINYYLENNKIDINVLESKLNALKIEDDSNFGYAYYSPTKNVLAVNPKIMENLSRQNNISLDEVYERVISHETNHLLQSRTNEFIKENKLNECFGPCIKSENLNVNSLYWEWYIESSAEQMTLNSNNYDSNLTYSYDIQALNGIKIATVFNNRKYNELENLTLSNDIDKFFTYFNCKNDQDKKNIIELFYKINLITEDSYTSTSEDFYNYFKEKKGYRLTGEEKTNFLYNVTTSVAMDEVKMFYKNLITEINNKEYKLEDILHLISIEETEMSRLVRYAGLYNLQKNDINVFKDEYKDFLEKYSNIYDSFIDELSRNYNISKENIENIYDKYYIEKHSVIDCFDVKNNLLYNKIELDIEYFKKNSLHLLCKQYCSENVKTY